MKKGVVLPYSLIPAHLPLFHTLTTVVFLSYFKAPGWLWGVVSTVFAVWWILYIIKLIVQEQSTITEIMEEEKRNV